MAIRFQNLSEKLYNVFEKFHFPKKRLFDKLRDHTVWKINKMIGYNNGKLDLKTTKINKN